MKATRASIEAFLAPRKLAIAGVSRNPKKFGNQVFNHLRERGYEVIPVHPEAEMIDGIPCHRNPSTLPGDVKSLLILTPKKETQKVVAGALEKGIDHIWIQQMSDTPEALALAASRPVSLITGECILMHTEPVKGVHKFHRAMRRFFGKMPA
ncbi:MAG TPA: CoA-binding protein [Bacteroidales bacterium]|nr:CoA-binding protein [Bacteroidales bacterium]